MPHVKNMTKISKPVNTPAQGNYEVKQSPNSKKKLKKKQKQAKREKKKKDKIAIMRKRTEQTTTGITRDFGAQPKTLCNSGLFLFFRNITSKLIMLHFA